MKAVSFRCRPAWARPPIIRPFQPARILSSRPGRTRALRAANSFCMAPDSTTATRWGERPTSAGDVRHVGADAQMPAVLEVGRAVQAKAAGQDGVFLGAEQGLHLGAVPGVEAAFLALGIGIQRGVKAAARRAHLAQRPLAGGVQHGVETRAGGDLRRLRVQAQQLAVVGQHFLEVRDVPFGIDRVAAKAAAQMVVDAAAGHLFERQQRHAQRLFVAAAGVFAQAALDQRRLRELGRAAKAAVHGVEQAAQFGHGAAQRCVAGCCLGVAQGLVARQGVQQLLVLLVDLRPVAAVVLVHPAQQVGEGRQAVAGFLGEIGAAEERHLVRGQKHGQRPAAAATGQHLVGQLIDAVQVRPFLAIDLDVDEQAVHHRRRGGVLEGLVRHHVAPVAGRVANGKQDRLVLRARQGQRRVAPGVPVDRVVGVLQQVRTALGSQAVGRVAG